MGQETKLIPTTKAACGYPYCGVLKTRGGRGLYPTCVNLWLRSILMVRDVRGPKWLFIRFQKLELGGEIPRVFLDSPEIDHGLYVLLVGCSCDSLGNSKVDCWFVY